MSALLRHYIGGQAAFGERLPPPLDPEPLRHDLERAGAAVQDLEPATPVRNHHRFLVVYRGRELLVLLNRFFPVVALAVPGSQPAYVYKDSQPLHRALRLGWEVAERRDLERPPAQDEGELSLGDEMEALVRRVSRTGDIVFNHWE